MRRTAFWVVAWVGGMLAAAFAATSEPAAVAGPPAWAYPLNPNGKPKPMRDDGALLHVPDSNVAMTLSATHDLYAAPDWHPDRHPPMPEVVARGRKPGVMACAVCHLPNGRGRPEDSSLAGLSADYIAQQIAAFKDGNRRGAQPAMIAPGGMIETADHASADEVAAAAAYYASLSYGPWIRVVETDMVPKTEVRGISALAAVANGGSEPIGDRIIEIPENGMRAAYRDDASGFVAYVPRGSLARGDALVHRAQDGRAPCGTCHGAHLEGSPSVPPLAGRSPSYLFRQLYDIKAGTRADPGVAPMRNAVASLSDADMLAIAAYLAAQRP